MFKLTPIEALDREKQILVSIKHIKLDLIKIKTISKTKIISTDN